MTRNEKTYFLIGITLMLTVIISIVIYYFIKINRLNKSKSMIYDKNVNAFLKVIRIGEGTSDVNGYRRIFGGRLFDDFSKHPNIKVTASGYTSTAAGAYQFLFRTWNELQSKYNLPDFSPQSQDLAAVIKIDERGALDLVKAGRFDEAVKMLNKEWASLPGSPYGQPTVNLAMIRNKFVEYGGKLA